MTRRSVPAAAAIAVSCLVGAASACTASTSSQGGGTSGISVTVDPAYAYVAPSGTTPFAARVAGTTNTAVNWTVVETNGGTVSGTGLYTAPTGTGTFTVKATSQADTGKWGTASVVVMTAGRWTTWNPGIPGGIPSATWTVRTLPSYATYNTGAVDASTAIQNEINAAAAVASATNPQVVYLPAGKYRVNNSVSLNQANWVVLRGAGPGSTRGTGGTAILNYSGGPAVVFNPSGHGWRPVNNCTTSGVWQTIPQDADRIPVASTTGWAVGDFLILDQADDQTRVFTNYDEQCRSPTKADYPLSPNYTVNGR
jgi:hypothetical protein